MFQFLAQFVVKQQPNVLLPLVGKSAGSYPQWPRKGRSRARRNAARERAQGDPRKAVK